MDLSEDGTIPDPLTMDHVWYDSHGRLRLCDQGLREPTEADPKTADSTNCLDGPSQLDAQVNRQRAVGLLAELAELCTRDEEAPAEALDLRNELANSAGSTLCPESVVERLRQFVELPYRLRWDDRLGAPAIAAGLEAALLSPLPFAIACVLTHLTQDPNHMNILWFHVTFGIAQYRRGYFADAIEACQSSSPVLHPNGIDLAHR